MTKKMPLRSARPMRASRVLRAGDARTRGGGGTCCGDKPALSAFTWRSPMATRVEAQTSMSVSDYDYSSFFYSSSDDPFAILEPYNEWYTRAVQQGYYLFAQAMSTPPQGWVHLTEGLHHRHVKLLNLS